MTRVIICKTMIENLEKLNPKTDEEREAVRDYMSWLKSELHTSEGMVSDKINEEQFRLYHQSCGKKGCTRRYNKYNKG